MGALQTAYSVLYIGTEIALAACIFFCLVRAVIGPRTTDRIIAINMIGTMTIIIIAVLSLHLKESYLLDVALIYAMISFLAVVVLTKVYMGVHKERELEAEKKKEETEEEEGGRPC